MLSLNSLQQKLQAQTKSPPKLTISEWAERYRILSPESSSQPGRWKTFSYQREMMNEILRPDVSQITIQSSSQIGKTAVLESICGYYISYEPCPMMIVQPTFSMAEAFVKDRLNPLI